LNSCSKIENVAIWYKFFAGVCWWCTKESFSVFFHHDSYWWVTSISIIQMVLSPVGSTSLMEFLL